jgi:hypothetical protein
MPNIGDRYIALDTAYGWTANRIYEWNGATWDETIPVEGDIVFVTDIQAEYVFTAGGTWSGPTSTVKDVGMEILTPMSKVERVSRQMDPDTFVIVRPGLWAVLENDGTLTNVVTDTPDKVNKLVIGSRTGNIYESHDTAHGRISTMESIGIRIRLTHGLYVGAISVGDRLTVSTFVSTKGKLISIESAYETGDYEAVAMCEEAHITEGYIIIRTISPVIVTVV